MSGPVRGASRELHKAYFTGGQARKSEVLPETDTGKKRKNRSL